jgi:hypothetical protein
VPGQPPFPFGNLAPGDRTDAIPPSGKITEDRCLTEEKALYLTPFLPLSTDLPP